MKEKKRKGTEGKQKGTERTADKKRDKFGNSRTDRWAGRYTCGHADILTDMQICRHADVRQTSCTAARM